ncbi:Uncharacterized protein DAT39_000374 [Clarias magur]|uniref:Uncharacterized protein n=1 Tax=Clarias magur TaxID=1594786 RepID=A0A8J4XHN8_CLAMG|nr:Uncharacterized protein DAT39_000374 [Clarias magur]
MAGSLVRGIVLGSILVVSVLRAHRCSRQWPLIGLAVGGPAEADALLETSPLDTVLSCCEKGQRKKERSAAPDGGSEAVCSVTDFSKKLDPLSLPSELQSGETLSDCALRDTQCHHSLEPRTGRSGNNSGWDISPTNMD